MMTLEDGPAMGSYIVQRAPLFMRAVVNSEGKGDVLNELDDTPEGNDTVSVYRLTEDKGMIHVNARRFKGFIPSVSHTTTCPTWTARACGTRRLG